MKKTLFYLAAILFVAVLSISLTSCSKDDDEDSVIGTWVGRDEGEDIKLVFKKGGTGTFININQRGKIEDGPFAYVMEGDSKGIIIYPDEDEKEYFVISGKTMRIYRGGYNGRLDLVLTKS